MANQKQPKTSKTPGKGKRVNPRVGDLVTFRSNLRHMTGTFGEVVAVIDKDHVVVRTMGCDYEDYDNRLWVLLTYKPTGTNEDGEHWSDLTMWVRKITYSRKKLPPKVRKPEKAALVINGQDHLVRVLTGHDDGKHDAVVINSSQSQVA